MYKRQIVPGVMAQTGMESLEIIRGVIRETEPDCIVAVDALAARSVKRLNLSLIHIWIQQLYNAFLPDHPADHRYGTLNVEL